MTEVVGEDRSRPSEERQGKRRGPVALVSLGLSALLVVGGFLALGTWQVHRLSSKLALIARVDHRIHAPPLSAPTSREWSSINAAADEYRHVEVTGTYLNNQETLVQAVTGFGAGFWVVTPLRSVAGEMVLVNRGFVPPDRRYRAQRALGEIAGPVTIVGLLRVSEPKGGFLRRNDPANDRWFSRDVGAIASARRLDNVAPFFIDADGTPNRGGFPIGGLTVVSFANNHLVYAFTWYALAAMLAGAALWLGREEWRRTGKRSPARLMQAGSVAAPD